MHRGDHQVVVIEPRRPGQVGSGNGRIERDLDQRIVQRRPACRRIGQPLQVGDAHRGVPIAGPDRVEHGRQDGAGPVRDLLEIGSGGKPGNRRGHCWPGPLRNGAERFLPAVERRRNCQSQGVDHPPRVHRPDALMQAEQPEPGEIVGRVGHHPGCCQEILDVRRLGELQPAVFHERDAAGGQFDLKHITMVRGPDEHRLLAQVQAGLMRRKHPGADLARLGCLVVAAHQHGRLPAASVRGERELKALGLRPDHVRQLQHRRPGPIVRGQPDHVEAFVGIGKRPEVRRIRAAEAVHSLGIIADAGQATAVGR